MVGGDHFAGDQRASMRPPVLPSGNSRAASLAVSSTASRFNEAAGFTQRKQPLVVDQVDAVTASMRPPVLPSGNSQKIVARFAFAKQLQ